MAKSPNSLYQRLGDYSFPIVAADLVEGSFPDHARDHLLNLFEAAINDELADAWTTATSPLSSLQGTSPVQSKVPHFPSKKILHELKVEFPALFLHRIGEATNEEHTLQLEKRVQRWGCHYVLPPLGAAGQKRVGAVTEWVSALIQLVIRRQGHPAYQNGVVQIGSGYGRVSALRVVSTETGSAPFADDEDGPEYPACSLTLESSEVDAFVDGAFPPLTGVTLDVGVGDHKRILPSVIRADTSVPLK